MNFPRLSSGAITQYPAATFQTYVTEVIRFLDGSDQRFRTRSGPLRMWELRLDLLNETEIQQLEAFYEDVRGQASTFIFSDPLSGVDVPNCRFGTSQLTSEYKGVDDASLSMWVVEAYG